MSKLNKSHLSIVEIDISPKLLSMSKKIQIQDIANKLAMMMYEKPMTTGYNGCLGASQSIRSRQLKDKIIHVNVPRSLSTDKECTKIYAYIKNVISHGSKNGVNISLLET